MFGPDTRSTKSTLFAENEGEDRRIRVVETSRDLSELESFWKEATRTSESPFSSWDWNQAWWEHLSSSEGRPLFLVCENSSSHPECVFPFVETEGKLDLAGADWCDFQDAIVTGECELHRGIEALFAWIHRRGLELSLTKLSQRGKLLPALERSEVVFDQFLFDFQLHGPCPWMKIRGDGMQEITSHFSKSTRKGLRRRIRQLREEHDAQLRVLERLEAPFLEEASRIHRERHEESVFRDPAFVGFLRKIDQSDEVGLISFALESKEKDLIAFEIGFERSGRFFSWLGGYAPSFADYRPGTSLQTLVMEALAARGTRCYDFLCGGEKYKFHFAEEEYQVRTAKVVQKNPIQAAVIGMQRTERTIRPFVKQALQKAGLYRTSYRIDREI